MYRLAKTCGCITLFAAFVAPVHPQSTQSDESRPWPDGSVSLNDGWRMQQGDNPAYAQPDYDDSAWQTVSLAAPMQSKSSQSNTGYRWFRLRLPLPPAGTPLALLVAGGDGTYDLFINGNKLPNFGIQPASLITGPSTRLVELDRDVNRGSAETVIALRTFVPASDLFQRSRDAWRFRFGTRPAIEAEFTADRDSRLVRLEPSFFMNLVIILAGIAILALYAVQQEHREYLWLAIYLLMEGVAYSCWTLINEGFLPLSGDIYANVVGYLALIAQVEFCFSFAGVQVRRAWRIYEVLLIVAALGMGLLYFGQMSTAFFNMSQFFLLLPAGILLPVQLLAWYRRGNREAGWLIFPILLPSITSALYDFGYSAALMGWTSAEALTRPFLVGSVPIQQWDVANLAFVPAIAAVIILRFTRVSREQARSAAELNAAREIQQRLVPVALPQFSNCRMEAAYLPAQEVGGDFYRVVEQHDGSILIVVGDVSGKGLRAAMTGASAIGALQAISATTTSPAVLLEALNSQIHSTGDSGFITCLCAALTQQGVLTLANAGHLAPYLNGREVTLECGLPLGIVADAVYPETTVHLAPGDRITMISDGVVEARDAATGELYGFERTAAISTQTAEAIAATAQAHGQEDDITVLTLTLMQVQVAHV
jgi:sigma-B regulation protein RsbU (phosphoserine phosphatase)